MEGIVTKKVELRGIGIFSTFKIFFSIIMIFSLVSFVLMNLFGMQIVGAMMQGIGSIQQFIAELRAKFPGIFENEILMALIIAIVNGVIFGLITAIGAAIFSLFALLMGGVRIKIREKTPEKKTAYL